MLLNLKSLFPRMKVTKVGFYLIALIAYSLKKQQQFQQQKYLNKKVYINFVFILLCFSRLA